MQTTSKSFDFNGESDLDLEYAFALTSPQPITLLQTGDLVEGKSPIRNRSPVLMRDTGASFDNWLDAIDGSFCSFEGGDNPNFV